MCYFSDAKNTIVFTPLGLVVLEGGGSRSRAPAALAEGLTMPPASKPRSWFVVSATLGWESSFQRLPGCSVESFDFSTSRGLFNCLLQSESSARCYMDEDLCCV